MLNRSKESNPKFERAFCDTTDQMKIDWLFLNSMFAWFMVTLTSLDISLILCKTIHWALKLQEAKQHVYVVHYKEFTNILTCLSLIWNKKVQLEITDLSEICV